ncbi:unnamed protein product [Closterium sp. Yama58-4]|nr:unnamed protein product [Closterium sp. Yama58-4]
MTDLDSALSRGFRPKDEKQKLDHMWSAANHTQATYIHPISPLLEKMDAVTEKSVKSSPVSPFQFFPTTPQCPSLSPSSSPESSHVTAVSYKDDPSPPIGLSLSPPCPTSAQSEVDDHISPSAESAKASADVSSHWKLPHPKTIKPQPSTVPLPVAAETETKAAPSVPTPFPHFPAPAAAPVPFGHIPPYPAAAAAGWWAPFAAFPSHVLLAHSPAAGQAQQQAMGAQQRTWVSNAPPWFCFGPSPFLSPARPALLAPGVNASDVNLEINKSLMAVSKPSLSGDGSRTRVPSSVATKASVKRSPSAKLATKPVEVLPRERLATGFRPWKAASRSSGSNDTSALLSSNGATTTCSAAVEACASSRRAVPFALKPCSQGTEGLHKLEADGQPIRPAAQQPRGQAGPVNAVKPVNAVNPVNTISPMSHFPTPIHILPAISPVPSFQSAAADQARAYACTMGQYPGFPWTAAAAAAAAGAGAGAGGAAAVSAAGVFGFLNPAGTVASEAGAGVVGDKRRLGRAEGTAAGSVDVQGKRKKRQKHGGVGSEVVEGTASLRMNGKSGEMEGECGRSKEQEEEERSKDNEKEREKEKEKACRNCGTHTTPFWRKDRSGSGQHLCNACGLYLAKNDAPRPSVLWKKESQGAPDTTSHALAAKA